MVKLLLTKMLNLI